MSAPAKRKSRLVAIAPGIVEPRKPKVLIYGAAGVGKTWTSLDFPKPYYIDTESGADLKQYRDKLTAVGGMYMGPDQGSLDFETVIQQIEALATEKHEFQTIILDSVTKLFSTAIADEQMRLGDKDAFGASKKAPIRQMSRLVRWLNRCDMNAIIIAHERDLWGLDGKGNREVVGKIFDASEKLEYDLHLVLRIIKIGAGENARRFAHIGKSRLTGFPEGDRFDWGYLPFAERYGIDVVEKPVVPVVLASAEEIAELNRLLELVKLPDGITKKWLNAAEAETFEEMSGAQIQACIDYVNKTIAKGQPT